MYISHIPETATLFAQKELLSSETSNDDQLIVKFVNRILLDAIEKNASDIHFELYEQNYRVRFRLDGLLLTAATPPLTLATRICARIKILSGLDISERRLPQDGRFRMELSSDKFIDFRVSTCPTVDGEKLVMRLLNTKSMDPDIEQLCFLPQQKKHFLSALSRPQGLILVTGPTGSGKTHTLYSALALLNTIEKNICSVEDPVEIKMHGINQVHINLKAGLTFANTLRAFLRQDPDVIMIGEIRDIETAEIAVKAANTGHLVLSTLHTNSAAETLTRLTHLNLSSFNIANAIKLIIAQRLVRRLCSACKVIRNDLTPHLINELRLTCDAYPIVNSYKAQGCNQCTNGYKGRIALFEVMPISKNLAQLIMQGQSSIELLKQAQAEGMYTLFQAGLEKIKEGLTSLEEIIHIMTDI